MAGESGPERNELYQVYDWSAGDASDANGGRVGLGDVLRSFFGSELFSDAWSLGELLECRLLLLPFEKDCSKGFTSCWWAVGFGRTAVGLVVVVGTVVVTAMV